MHRLNQFDKAIKYLTWHIKEEGDVLGYLNRSQVFADIGYYKEALQDAEEAIKLDQTNSKCYELKSRALLGLGRINEVWETFED